MKKSTLIIGLGAAAFVATTAFAGRGGVPNGKPFIALQNQIIEVQGAVTDITDTAALLVESVETIEEEVGANQDAIATLETTTAALQSQIDASADSVNDVLAVTAELQADNVALSQQILALGGEDEHLEGLIADNNAQILALQSSLQGEISSIMVEIADLDSAKTELESSVAAMQASITSLESEVSSNASTIASNQSNISALQAAISGFGTQISSLESDISDLQDQIATVGDANGSLQAQINAKTAEIASLQGQIDNNTAAIAANETNIATLEADQSVLSGNLAALEAQDSDLQDQLDANAAAIAENEALLESTRSDLQGQIDQNAALIAALQTDITLIQAELDLKQNLINGICPNGTAVTRVMEDGTLVCGTVGGSGGAAGVGQLETYLGVKAMAVNALQSAFITATCDYEAGYRATGGGFYKPYRVSAAILADVYFSNADTLNIDGKDETVSWSVGVYNRSGTESHAVISTVNCTRTAI